MDANEPEIYDTNILNWKFWDNKLDKFGVIDSKKTFDFISSNYDLLKNGATYKTKHYDHIFYKKRRIKVIKTKVLNKLLNHHKSDHKPITIKITLLK